MSFRPNLADRFVTPDGKLSIEGYKVLNALFERFDAIAALSDPAGGGTVDTEARAAIAALLDAAG